MSSKQVQLSSLSPSEIKNLAPSKVQTLLLTVNINTLNYRQLQAFVMYLRLNKWTRPDFKANQKKAILLAEVTSQIAAAQRQAKPTNLKAKPKPKNNAAPFKVNRLVSDRESEIIQVANHTGFTCLIKQSKKYKREVVRLDTVRKVYQSDCLEPVEVTYTVMNAYYVEGKGWRDAVSPRKATVTYYPNLLDLVISSKAYENSQDKSAVA